MCHHLGEVRGALDILALHGGPDTSRAAAEAILQLRAGHVIFNPAAKTPLPKRPCARPPCTTVFQYPMVGALQCHDTLSDLRILSRQGFQNPDIHV